MRFDTPSSYFPRLTKATFSGTAIPLQKLIPMMYPKSGGRQTFEYSSGRQFRINGVATRELLANPDCTIAKTSPALSSSNHRPYHWTSRGPGVLPLRRRRRRVHRTRHLQQQQEGRRVLSQGRLRFPCLRRLWSHGWPPPLWDVERWLDQCPCHVCYPCLVAHRSHQGEVSTRRLQPHYLVKARTATLVVYRVVVGDDGFLDR